jgi:hypothetical protein
MLRWLAAIVSLALLIVGGLFFYAGRQTPPQITIGKPAGVIGQRADLRVDAAGAHLQTLTIALEQNGRRIPLFARKAPELFNPGAGPDGATLSISEEGSPVTVERPIGKQSVPELQEGPARMSWTVDAVRSRDERRAGRLQPPRVRSSDHHYVNHGGSRWSYRHADVARRTGRLGRARRISAAGAGLPADPALKGLFALLHEQTVSERIALRATSRHRSDRDSSTTSSRSRSRRAASRSTTSSCIASFPRYRARTRIEGRRPVGDEDCAGVPEDQRRLAADERRPHRGHARVVAHTVMERPFVQLGNSQVEAGFADHRTYLRSGTEIDQQTHSGPIWR